MRDARVFVDSRGGAEKESGDVINAGGCGKVVEAEIGEVISAGERISKSTLTVYKSLGMSVQDLAAAKMVNERQPRTASLKVPLWSDKDFLEEPGAESPSCRSESLRTSVSTPSKVEVCFEATLLNDLDLLVCEAGCSKSRRINLVYRAATGELEGIAYSERFDRMNLEERVSNLCRLIKTEK